MRVKVEFGNKASINMRIKGWEETKEENLVIVAPEVTVFGLEEAVKKRGLAVQKGVRTKFIENINTHESYEKNKKRIEQGIPVRHFDWHDMSVSIRDGKIVYLEFADLKVDKIVIRIEDVNFAAKMVDFFNELWEKAKPFEELKPL